MTPYRSALLSVTLPLVLLSTTAQAGQMVTDQNGQSCLLVSVPDGENKLSHFHRNVYVCAYGERRSVFDRSLKRSKEGLDGTVRTQRPPQS